MARWTTSGDKLIIGTPIIRGFDWGGGDGYGLTNDQNISGFTFSIALKNGEQTRVELTEANGYIRKSGSYTLYIRIPASETGGMKPGETLTGNIMGQRSGYNHYFGTIQVQTE